VASKGNRPVGSRPLRKDESGIGPILSVIWLFVLVILAGACATSGNGSGSPEGLLTWAPGEYSLEGSVEYQDDREGGVRTVRADYWGELTIATDGSMRMNSSTGNCRERLPQEVMRDESARRRSFPCGEGTYFLAPRGEMIKAEILVSVLESIRRRQCTRWVVKENGQRVCAAFSYTLDTRRTTKPDQPKVVRR